MPGASDRLEKDLAALSQTTVAIAAEFHDAYHSYLTVLGSALSQNLILASYHICTQGYPESFLKLSWERRHELQQALRQLAEQARSQLLDLLESPQLDEPMALTDLIKSESKNPDSTGSAETAVDMFEEGEEMLLDNGYSWQKEEDEETFVPDAEEAFSLDREDSDPTLDRDLSADSITTTEDLLRWQSRIETSIKKILQQISRSANLLLRRAAILPRQLPEAVLEAAAKTEASTEPVAGPPNLLVFRIETERGDKSAPAEVMHLMAIHLRVVEIELADSAAMAGRKQLRELIVRGKKLHRDRMKTLQALAIAQAEDAWRSSWSN